MITDYTNRFGVNLAPTPKNDPKLLALVWCVVLRPFFVAGKEVKINDKVKLPLHDAESLRALGKVQIQSTETIFYTLGEKLDDGTYGTGSRHPFFKALPK